MVAKSLESLCAAFFWGGHEDTKKIAWVKWSNILASLDKVGLGVAIHGDEAGVDLRGYQTNEVWASIVGTINHLHSSGIVPLNAIHFNVGDGSSICFWKDTLLGDKPLYIRYDRLFHLANNKDCFIRQRIINDSWNWDWSRPITMGRMKAEFDNLILDIAILKSDEIVDSDSCIWNLSNDDTFSVNKVRKHIEECFLPMLSPGTHWLFDLGFSFPIFCSCEDRTFGLIRGTLLRTRSLMLIPSSRLHVGPFGVTETISLLTLNL
nr:RNA-directed DNA polymerase, eukaryota, reverse transcriptase zinc-binding domain protein [Tanacetum cinerariifolium]